MGLRGTVPLFMLLVQPPLNSLTNSTHLRILSFENTNQTKKRNLISTRQNRRSWKQYTSFNTKSLKVQIIVIIVVLLLIIALGKVLTGTHIKKRWNLIKKRWNLINSTKKHRSLSMDRF